MLDGKMRATVERGLRPLGTQLGRVGITPDVLTVLGVAFAVATAVAVATGHFVLGAAGIGLSGLGDLLDGNLARSSGRTGPRGAFFDSVTDRVSDAVVLGGFAWYLDGRGDHTALLPFAVAALSMLISYERAKAEGMGFTAKGGLMERAERSILLAIALLVPHAVLPVLWIMLVLTAFTAVQRFVRVWRQAERPPAPVRERRVTRHRTVDGPGKAPNLRAWLDNTRGTRRERVRPVHPARRARP